MREASILRRRLTTVAALAIVGFLLFPVYWMLNAALQKNATSAHVEWFPIDFSLVGMEKALSTQLGSLGISLVIACGAVVVSLVIAIPAAYSLSQLRLPWAGAVISVVLVVQMIPGIVIANSLYTIYNSAHLLNSFPGLILADSTSGIPFSILLLRSFMIAIPRELVEAARVDGSGRLRTLVSIIVPLARNAIVTAGLFSFLFAWGDLVFALTLTTNESFIPLTLGIYRFLGVYGQDWSTVMAAAILASLPAAVLLVTAQRYITSGIAGGALK